MEKKDILTKILTIGGTVLVSLTVLAPVILSIISLLSRGGFRFDYLMPAELFIVALVGGLMLLWGALRTRSNIKWIAWSLGMAVFLLFASQGLAVVTGLASGETAPEGWKWIVTLAGIIGYDLSVLVLSIGGILMLRKLFA